MTAPTPLPLHVCLAIAPELAVADAALALAALESIPKAMITKRKRKRKLEGKQRFVGCEFLLPPTVGIRSAVATVVLMEVEVETKGGGLKVDDERAVTCVYVSTKVKLS